MEKLLKYGLGFAAVAAVGIVAYVGLNTYNAPEKKPHPGSPPKKPQINSRSVEKRSTAPVQSAPQRDIAAGWNNRRPLNLTALNLQQHQMSSVNETNKVVFDGMFVLGKTSNPKINSLLIGSQRSVSVQVGTTEHICIEENGVIYYCACDSQTGQTITQATKADAVFDRMTAMVEAIA